MSSVDRCSVDGVMCAVLAPGRPGPIGVLAWLMRVMCSGTVSRVVTRPPLSYGSPGGAGRAPVGPLLITTSTVGTAPTRGLREE